MTPRPILLGAALIACLAPLLAPVVAEPLAALYTAILADPRGAILALAHLLIAGLCVVGWELL